MKEKMSAKGGSAFGGKIAIISDIHNNEVNLKKVLDYCARENIKTIICCGDLASKETLDFLNDNFLPQGSTLGRFKVEPWEPAIHFTFGNADWSWEEEYKSIKKYKKTLIYKDFGETEAEGKKIAFVHYPKKAKELCQGGKYNFVFHGHTHKPWEENIGECKMLNPGNVAGEIYPPTFAVWNTENNKFELIRIHDLK